jgi:hypothetical protein
MASLWVFQSINQGSVVAGYGARVSDGQSLETAHKVNATQTAAQNPAIGLADKYGDDIEELAAKAVANDVARSAGQQLIIRRASENAPKPSTWQAPRRGWPRKVRAAEGVTP